jgi:hypothetical protein
MHALLYHLQVAEWLNTTPETVYLATPLFFAAWPVFWTALAFIRGKFAVADQELEIY